MKKRESPENIIQIYENNFFLPREGRAKMPQNTFPITGQRRLRAGGGEWWDVLALVYSQGKDSIEQESEDEAQVATEGQQYALHLDYERLWGKRAPHPQQPPSMTPS